MQPAIESTAASSLARLYQRIAEKRFYAYLVLLIVTFLGVYPNISDSRIPNPGVHDEFSYLLAAQTYASGRLSNPPPPHPEVFETFHVILHPSYMSKYPPGIGLQLALGVILGNPILGVWITVLAIGLVAYEMVLRFANAGWALPAALTAILQFNLSSYFGFSYWGGSLFMLAGMMATWAFLGLDGRPHRWFGVLLGGAGGVMLLTRPLEGAAFGIIAVAILILSWWRAKQSVRAWVLRALLPAFAGFLPSAVFLLMTNHAVTGSALTTPYAVYLEAYPTTTVIGWNNPAELREDIPREFRLLAEFNRTRRVHGVGEKLEALPFALQGWMRDFFPGVLGAFFLAFLVLSPNRTNPFFLLIVALIGARIGLYFALSSYVNPHYFAAWQGPLLLAEVAGAQKLLQSFPQPSGRLRATAVLASLWLIFVANDYYTYFQEYSQRGFRIQRMLVDGTLRIDEAEKDLVFVRYGDDLNPFIQWIYNEPDIANAPVIWARYLGPESVAEVSATYAGRKVWMLEPPMDGTEPEPIPYDEWLAAQTVVVQESQSVE